MDIIQTATKIAARFIPFFGKPKTVKQIGTEIGEAADNELSLLWNKVKPWFIKEYEEEKPIDESFEVEDIKALVKAELKKADEATKAAIENALKQQNTATTNITQTHSGTGDNVGGNKNTYNINKIDNANFS